MWDRIRRVGALLADPRTPKLPRFAVVFAVLYLISPVDVIPDWIFPVIGWLDDLTLLWLGFRWLLKSGPPAQPAPAPTADLDRKG